MKWSPANPAVASDPSGNFVVVWQSYTQDGSLSGISQGSPAVASGSSGNFVVVWRSYTQDGSEFGVFGQRYSQIVPVELMHFRVE